MKKGFNIKFFENWSPEMAYVLGFTFADGSLYTNPGGYYYLEFTSIDLELIVKVRKLLKSEHKIGVRDRKLKNPRHNISYRLQIYAKDILNDLTRLGIIPRKSLVIDFPEVPEKFLGHFIRGYFDGDGNVNLGKYWRKDRKKEGWVFDSRFTSGSKLFLIGLKQKLSRFTEGGFIRGKSNHRGYDLVFSRHDSLKLFNLMYCNTSSNMFLKRKYNTFQKAFKVLDYKITRA